MQALENHEQQSQVIALRAGPSGESIGAELQTFHISCDLYKPFRQWPHPFIHSIRIFNSLITREIPYCRDCNNYISDPQQWLLYNPSHVYDPLDPETRNEFLVPWQVFLLRETSLNIICTVCVNLSLLANPTRTISQLYPSYRLLLEPENNSLISKNERPCLGARIIMLKYICLRLIIIQRIRIGIQHVSLPDWILDQLRHHCIL